MIQIPVEVSGATPEDPVETINVILNKDYILAIIANEQGNSVITMTNGTDYITKLGLKTLGRITGAVKLSYNEGN